MVLQGDAIIDPELFFAVMVRLGTIFDDLGPFGTDFGASEGQF